MAHERRAVSKSGRPVKESWGTAVWIFIGDGPTDRQVRQAWLDARGSGIQNVNITGRITIVTQDGLTVVTAHTQYGPVHGNAPSDHRRKIARTGKALGAANSSLVGFKSERVTTQ